MEKRSNEVIPFCFRENLVRVFTDGNGEPWWVAKDVCGVLEIQNSRDAISALDEDEKITVDITDGNPRAGVPHEMSCISESGLYALVFRSRKPEAKMFSKWVRSEVLPSIRKTGRYVSPSCVRRTTELPDDLPLSALELRPTMRQRLWRDALETARLGGGDVRMALSWFDKFCRMMACGQIVPDGCSPAVRQFFDDCCVEQSGARISSRRLYEAMRQWCKGKNMDMPSVKVFGESMGRLARYLRSNGSHYLDIALR